MSQQPPRRDDPDDVDDHYRRASALDASHPSERVRRAVLAHAAHLAAERARARDTAQRGPTASYQTRLRPAIFGTMAAAALVGLLIAPRFLAPTVSGVRMPAPAQQPEERKSVNALASRAAEVPRASEASAPARAEPSGPSPDKAPVPARVEPAGPRPTTAPAPAITAPPPAMAPGEAAGRSAGSAATESAVQAPPGERPSDSASRQESRAVQGLTHRSDDTFTAASPIAAAIALRRAAETGDIKQLQAVLDGGVDIDARDDRGRTPLMLATLHGQSDAVAILLEHGAAPNVPDMDGTTPLQAAIARDESEIAATLRLKGAR